MALRSVPIISIAAICASLMGAISRSIYGGAYAGLIAEYTGNPLPLTTPLWYPWAKRGVVLGISIALSCSVVFGGLDGALALLASGAPLARCCPCFWAVEYFGFARFCCPDLLPFLRSVSERGVIAGLFWIAGLAMIGISGRV